MKQWLIHGGRLEDMGTDLVLHLTADEFRTLRHTLESSRPRTARFHTLNGYKVTLREANVSNALLIRTDDHLELLVPADDSIAERIVPLCDDKSPVWLLPIQLDNDEMGAFVLERDQAVAEGASPD